MAGEVSNKIITEGLVLYLDAANRRSYPRSGTIWNDLSENRNNGTLINGPVFNDNNGGSVIFDGNDDYVDMGLNSKGSNLSDYTFGGWFKTVPGANNLPYARGIDSISPLFNEWSLAMAWDDTTKNIFAYVTTVDAGPIGVTYIAVSDPNSVLDDTWVYVVGVWNSGVGISLYINGAFISTQSSSGTQQLRNSNNFGWVLGVIRKPDIYTLSNIATFHVYNRVLSDQEILQNYNALKLRFIS